MPSLSSLIIGRNGCWSIREYQEAGSVLVVGVGDRRDEEIRRTRGYSSTHVAMTAEHWCASLDIE
jgi:hypothetical protein